MKELLQIKDVAKKYSVSKRTLRYYEEIGMLTTIRKGESNYRYYDSDALKRLEQILLLRKLDFSINEVLSITSSENIEAIKGIFHEKLVTLKRELHSMTLLKNTIEAVTCIIETKSVNDISIYEVLREQPYIYKEVERMIDMSTYSGDMIVIEFGEKVVPYGNDLINSIKELRKSVELKYNKEIPRIIRVRDNVNLCDNQVIVLFKSEEIYNSTIETKDNIKMVIKCLRGIIEENINEIAL